GDAARRGAHGKDDAEVRDPIRGPSPAGGGGSGADDPDRIARGLAGGAGGVLPERGDWWGRSGAGRAGGPKGTAIRRRWMSVCLREKTAAGPLGVVQPRGPTQAVRPCARSGPPAAPHRRDAGEG